MSRATAKQAEDAKVISDLFRDHAKRFAGLTANQQEALLADGLLWWGGMDPAEVDDLANRLQRQAWNAERMKNTESRDGEG